MNIPQFINTILSVVGLFSISWATQSLVGTAVYWLRNRALPVTRHQLLKEELEFKHASQVASLVAELKLTKESHEREIALLEKDRDRLNDELQNVFATLTRR